MLIVDNISWFVEGYPGMVKKKQQGVGISMDKNIWKSGKMGLVMELVTLACVESRMAIRWLSGLVL